MADPSKNSASLLRNENEILSLDGGHAEKLTETEYAEVRNFNAATLLPPARSPIPTQRTTTTVLSKTAEEAKTTKEETVDTRTVNQYSELSFEVLSHCCKFGDSKIGYASFT